MIELDNISQKIGKVKFRSGMLFEFDIDKESYIGDLYYSYIYWRDVIEIATLQCITNRFVACPLDNNLRTHHAINYYISKLKGKI